MFQKARDFGWRKSCLFSFTNTFSSVCTIKPPCRHCEWQSTRQFTLDAKDRKPTKDFVNSGVKAEKMGVDQITIPSGWMGYDLPDYFYMYIEELLRNVNIKVVASFGAINRESLRKLRDIGVEGYFCGIETTNQDIFRYMRPGDNFGDRITTLKTAKELGMKIGSSLVVGIGETTEDIAKGIELMREIGVDSAAIWPLCPSPYTEMERWNAPNPFMVAKIIATMVIALEKSDITADTRPANLKWGIRAGANAFSVFMREDMNRIKEMRESCYQIKR